MQRKRQLKTFHIKTYGCQMNELDTEVMAGQLRNRGLEAIDSEAEADLIIFNTCSIRDLAERKAMGKIGLLVRSPKKNRVIGVTGCMANAKKETLFRKLPHIDFVLGTSNIHDLDSVLDQVVTQNTQVSKTDKHFSHELNYLAAQRDDKVMAYVSIIRGCNKFCTYCVVPYTRGPEVSRPMEDIIQECRKLAENGYREVTLLGQNVNSYGNDKPEWNLHFHDLLYELDKIPGLNRIRFMTSHPYDITRELMEAIRDLPSLCEFVHFPIQAGSERVLRKMNRLYTPKEYLEKVTMLRELVPNVVLGTDIIIGFPTETEEEFQETYDILKKVEYSVAFLYTYSARQGTPAMRWVDDIPEEVKMERHRRLSKLQEEIYTKQRTAMLGKEVEILIEKQNFRDANLLKGRTRCWKNVLIPGGKELIGTLQKVKVHSFSNQTLLAELIEKQ